MTRCHSMLTISYYKIFFLFWFNIYLTIVKIFTTQIKIKPVVICYFFKLDL